jgi:hypothetical protein
MAQILGTGRTLAIITLVCCGGASCEEGVLRGPADGTHRDAPRDAAPGPDAPRDAAPGPDAPGADIPGPGLDKPKTDSVGPKLDKPKTDTVGPKPDSPKPADGGGNCLGAGLLASLGKNRMLVGASMEDTIAKQAPFDLRYVYIAGGLADGTQPCASCVTCTAGGVSCKNTSGCNWWGCWQWDQNPPGDYARGFITKVQADGQIPMFTYYVLLQASGVAEGQPEVTSAAVNTTFMQRYYADWRFLLQNIGQNVTFLHIEPDFWGYAQHVNNDPTKIPAAVASANPTDCAAQPNTIAGMGHCMIAMVRKYAPKAKVGLHASSWGTLTPALSNTNPAFDLNADAQKLATFLLGCGAEHGDYVVLDASDRDAGYYQSIGQNVWWDATNATLPHFTQAFTWTKLLAEKLAMPILWWQLPVGNMSLPNVTNQWKDNRVEYFFAHTADLAACHSVGIAFGAGMGGQTTPSTDNGVLVAKVKAYAAAGGQALCP